MQNKANIRTSIKKKIHTLTVQERKLQDAFICKELDHLCVIATCVYAYIPLADEVDIVPFLERVSRMHIPLFCTIQKNGVHTWHQCRIKKIPSNNTWQVHICSQPTYTHSPSHVIIPGRAFTKDGHRLGRGHGFYDHFLEVIDPQITKTIGVCYTCQIVDELPIEAHDKKVDSIVCTK